MVAMSEKVSAGRKAFGRDLRRAREAAGMTQADAGAALGVVPSAISSWERGTRRVDLPTATKLDRVYGSNKAITRKWHDLQRGADLDPWFQEISVIEEAAGELRDYQPLVWPGLVQTEAYARALTHDVWPGRSPESVESLVKSRLKRQELLGRPDSPLILMIVEEGVVYRRVGDLGTAEHRDQIQRAVDEIEAGTLRLQIVPRTAPSLAFNLLVWLQGVPGCPFCSSWAPRAGEHGACSACPQDALDPAWKVSVHPRIPAGQRGCTETPDAPATDSSAPAPQAGARADAPERPAPEPTATGCRPRPPARTTGPPLADPATGARPSP